MSSSENKTFSLAICGIRGIPACYGGFETFAEELSTRLVDQGHRVTVYGRSHVIDTGGLERGDGKRQFSYKGVDLVLLPALKHKYLETLTHTFFCLIHLLFNRADVILVCNAANSPLIWISKLFGSSPVAVNLDGIERKRSKWNSLGRIWYRLGERCSVWFADRLIADAEIIKRYYKKVYSADTELIRYGYRDVSEDICERKCAGDWEPLQQRMTELAPEMTNELSLRAGSYFLYVSRLEPENNALRCIRSYMKLPEAVRERYSLLVVGDAPYAEEYKQQLRDAAGPGVIFAGFRFNEEYTAAHCGAYLYLQATEVGGTHPALVESMGFANCIVANQTPEHAEVVADAGILYRKNDEDHLTQLLFELSKDSRRVERMRKRAYDRARSHFSWDTITERYADFFSDTIRGIHSDHAKDAST